MVELIFSSLRGAVEKGAVRNACIFINVSYRMRNTNNQNLYVLLPITPIVLCIYDLDSFMSAVLVLSLSLEILPD